MSVEHVYICEAEREALQIMGDLKGRNVCGMIREAVQFFIEAKSEKQTEPTGRSEQTA